MQLPHHREDGELRGGELGVLPPRPAAERDLGELLAGAEAVEDRRSPGSPARAAPRGCRSGSPSRRLGHGVPAGLSMAKSADASERRRHAAEPGAARAVGPQVRAPVRSAQGTSTTLPTVLRSASLASACGAWSSGSVSPTSGSTWPSCDEPGQLLVHHPEDRRVVLAVQPPVQADDAVVLDQQVVGLRLGDAAAGEPDDDEPPLERDALGATCRRRRRRPGRRRCRRRARR